MVKALPKGTQLAVKGLWKGTHYITVYSFDKKIPNGFLKSATIPLPPPPPPPSFWDGVQQISGSVTLYEDTNLVKLPEMAFVKKLVNGTKLSVKGLWKGSYYITTYSFDNRIPNGFAASATVPPPPPPPTDPCADVKRQLAECQTTVNDLQARIAAKDARLADYEQKILQLEARVRSLVNELAVCKAEQVDLAKIRDAVKALRDFITSL